MSQALEYGGGRPWHKRVLVPFWLIQIFFIGLTIISAALNLYSWVGGRYSYGTIITNGNTTTYTSGVLSGSSYSTNVTNGNKVSAYTSVSVSVGPLILFSVILAIAVISLLFSLIEVILFMRHHLTPTKYFVFNLLKFLGWTVLFLCAIPAFVLYYGSVWSLTVNIIEELTFLGTLIYGSVIYHRFRKERNMAMSEVKQPVYPQQQRYGQA